MKVLYLGSGESIHAIRWVRAIAERGHEVIFATQHRCIESLGGGVRVVTMPASGGPGYFLNALALRRLVKRIKPDVLHVNYAGGYGTTARLAHVNVPTVLTVWGSDVFEVPTRGWPYKTIIRGNLRAARVITSSSRAMADAVRELLPGANVIVVPFGVDTEVFVPAAAPKSPARVVGTVKGLEPVYGIDLLLRAFKLVHAGAKSNGAVRLDIAGTGSEESRLLALADSLGISDSVRFRGRVQHSYVPALLSTFSVYVALSRRESFGVGVIEASSCGIPVVASRVGGLPEVVADGITGVLVPPEDPEAAAEAILAILDNTEAAAAMGAAGREFVRANFAWDFCVDAMLQVYRSAVGGLAEVPIGRAPLSSASGKVSIEPCHPHR